MDESLINTATTAGGCVKRKLQDCCTLEQKCRNVDPTKCLQYREKYIYIKKKQYKYIHLYK